MLSNPMRDQARWIGGGVVTVTFGVRRLMKQFVGFLLFVWSLFPLSALAWCDNPDTGSSERFFVAIYTVSACNPNDKFPEGTEVIEFSPIKKNEDANGESQTFAFNDECTKTKNGSGFYCKNGGRTPLAGTTYVTTRDMKDVCDETGKKLVDRRTCTVGCEDGRAPKYIEGSPWEC